MSLATLVLLTVTLPLFLIGLVPCLGWVNWVGVPLAVSTALVGLAGLAFDREPETRRPIGGLARVLGLVAGILMAVLGSLRCLMGGGFF